MFFFVIFYSFWGAAIRDFEKLKLSSSQTLLITQCPSSRGRMSDISNFQEFTFLLLKRRWIQKHSFWRRRSSKHKQNKNLQKRTTNFQEKRFFSKEFAYGHKKKVPSARLNWRNSQVKVAMTYSPTTKCSTIGAVGLNFSVRDGKRWNPNAMITWISGIIDIATK